MRRPPVRVLFAAAFLITAAPPGRAQPKPAAPRLVPHTGQRAVTSLAFSPDGQRVVIGSDDRTARLWDAESGKELHVFKGHTNWWVTAVCFSPDGKRVLTGGDDWSARLWDAQTGRQLRIFKGHSLGVNAVAFSPDGKRVLTGSDDKTVRLWDAESGQEVRKFEGHTGAVHAVAFAPDGKRALTGSEDKTARFWDADTGRELYSKTHSATVWAVAFSADGKLFLTGGASGAARLWDAETGRSLRAFTGHSGPVRGVAISPDGKRVLTASEDKSARLWDADTGKELHQFTAHKNGVTAVAFSPDGKHALTGSWDSVALLWDAETGTVVRRFGSDTSAPRAVAVAQDGTRLLTWSGRTVYVWDGAAGRQVRRIRADKAVTAAAFSRDGKRAVMGVGKLAVLWDADTGKELRSFQGHSADVTAAAFSADGKLLLTGSADRTARLWDVESGTEVRTFKGHTGEITSAAISPDGKRVVTGSKDHTARLWDAATGKELWKVAGHVWEGQALEVHSVAFSSQGNQVLTAGQDCTAILWDAATGEKKRTFAGPSKWMSAAVFSPKGDRVLGCSWDGTARVWDAKNANAVGRLTGHTYGLYAGTYTPDGKHVLTASGDQTVGLWDATTGRLLCRLISFNNGSWAVVDSAGRYDASHGGDIEGLHWVVGDETIALSQLKERYYDPGLLAKKLGLSDEPLRNVAALDDVKLFPAVAVEQKDPKKAALNVTLTNRGGGIGKVVVLVNGKEYKGDARPRGATDATAAELELRVDLTKDPRVVPGGKNTVEVLAYNADGTLCSRGMVREFDDPNPAGKHRPELYAVVAGVSNYKGEGLNLRYAAKDADNFATALELAARSLFNEKSADGRVHVARLTGAAEERRPTRAALEKALGELKSTKAGDVIVVYLAGHGVTTGGQDGEWFFLGADAQPADVADPAVLKKVGLSSAKLTDLLKSSPAQKQVLILDTCHSGRVAEKLTEHRDVPGSQVRALERVKDRTGMYVLAGCAADSVSYEATRYGQGLLTYSLLLGMKGGKLREGQYVDVADLFGFAADKVPELARDVGGVQRPLIASPKGAPFDIGRLTADDRQKVPLQSVKPVVLRSNFQDDYQLRDGLSLARRVDERLRDSSAAARGGRLVFVDAAEFPGGVQAAGRYKVEGDKVMVTVTLFEGDKKGQPFTVMGTAGKPDELAEKVAAEIEKRLAAAGR